MRRNPNRPVEERARGQVRDAIMRGDLKPSRSCQTCGSEDRPCSDGRRYIQAHHHAGYENALSVQWLCPKCHRKETPIPAGEKNFFAKLSAATISEAERMQSEGMNYTEIAAKLGVYRTTVSRALRGKTYIAARNRAGEEGR